MSVDRGVHYCKVVPLPAGIIALMMAGGSPQTVIAQPAPEHVREISWEPQVRVADRLLPDDHIVVMTRESLEVVVPGRLLTIKQVIEEAAVRSDLVAVIDVDSVRGVLVQRDSWVDTRLTGTVRLVLRSSPAKDFQSGQRIEADFPNGEIVVGKVRVRAGDRAPVTIPIFPERQAYLLFLRGQGALLYTTHPPLIIRNGMLSYLSPFLATNKPPNALEGMTVDGVAEVVRNAKVSPMLGGGTLQPIGR